MRTLLTTLAAGLLAASALAGPAMADVLIQVDKSTQNMEVSVDGRTIHSWPVSTGRKGRDTPVISTRPTWMDKNHFSKEFDDAPMPNSIFFTDKGHAIHGTGHISKLGQPDSGGCIRLAPEHAEKLYALVSAQGMARTRIVVDGVAPVVAPAVAKVRQSPSRPRYYANEASAEEAGARYAGGYGRYERYDRYDRDVDYPPRRAYRAYDPRYDRYESYDGY